MKELVGALMDEGYSPQEVREMVGPMLAERDEEDDLGSHVHDPSGREQALRDILTAARDDRQPPGPTVVVPSGVIHSMPQSLVAKPVRVDTEDSYRAFRQSGQEPEDDVEALSTASQAELLGDLDRGYASQWMVGNIMDMVPASQSVLSNLSPHQTCIVCGADGGVVCPHCYDRMPEMIGLFDRGYASQWMVGFGERGAAASIHDDNPSATLDLGESEADSEELADILGTDVDEFYRLARGEGYSEGQSPLVGNDGFYRLPRHQMGAGGLSALIGNVMALAVPSTVYAEEIPLSFHRPDIHKHVAAWKQGAHIYGSIRVTGWDKQVRILTTATPYAQELGCVVGYSTSAAIAPTHMLAVADPLARRLGASRLFPRLAAAAPSVLRVSSDKSGPILLTVMPAGGDTRGWV